MKVIGHNAICVDGEGVHGRAFAKLLDQPCSSLRISEYGTPSGAAEGKEIRVLTHIAERMQADFFAPKFHGHDRIHARPKCKRRFVSWRPAFRWAGHPGFRFWGLGNQPQEQIGERQRLTTEPPIRLAHEVEEERDAAAEAAGHEEIFADVFVSLLTEVFGDSRIREEETELVSGSLD